MAEAKIENRASRFVKDIGLYAIGNLGSRLITFLLLPVYTFFIAPDDYGYYDICFSVVLFLMPFITFQMRDGVFRFLLDNDKQKHQEEIVTFVSKTLMRNSIACLTLTFVLWLCFPIKFLWLIVVFAISFSVYEVFIQVVRGLGDTKAFALSGIVCSFLIAIISLTLIIVFGVGVEAIFYANILARLVTILILETRLKVLRTYFKLSAYNKKLASEMLRYSFPLMIITLATWGMTTSNRFFVNHFLGLYETGIFAVVQKFADIMTTLSIIFYQAWQEMAIRQFGKEDKDVLYSRILNNYIYVLVLLVILLAFGVRIFNPWIISAQYQSCIQYMFVAVVVSIISPLCSFYEIGYQCAKKTMNALPGMLLAVSCSVLCNYFFVQWWGIYGILLATFVSYTTLLIYRIVDTRKFFSLRLYKEVFGFIILLVVSGIAYYMIDSRWLDIVFLIVVVAVGMALLPKDLKMLLQSKLTKTCNAE